MFHPNGKSPWPETKSRLHDYIVTGTAGVMPRHCFVYCSVCRWQHMLRYTSESLESNLWCFFDLNINTGKWKLPFRSTTRCFLTNWPPAINCCVSSPYWMSQTRTVRRTAKQPSSTRKTNGSTRRGFLPSLNRAGVTVDPRCCSCMNISVQNQETTNQEMTYLAEKRKKKLHILNSSTWYICPLTVAKFVCCCVLALMPAECCCWAIACVFSKLMYLVIAGLLAHAPPF